MFRAKKEKLLRNPITKVFSKCYFLIFPDPMTKNLISRKKGDIVNKFEYEKGAYKVKLYCTTYYAKQVRTSSKFLTVCSFMH
jgi:hypothetical protein